MVLYRGDGAEMQLCLRQEHGQKRDSAVANIESMRMASWCQDGYHHVCSRDCGCCLHDPSLACSAISLPACNCVIALCTGGSILASCCEL